MGDRLARTSNLLAFGTECQIGAHRSPDPNPSSRTRARNLQIGMQLVLIGANQYHLENDLPGGSGKIYQMVPIGINQYIGFCLLSELSARLVPADH